MSKFLNKKIVEIQKPVQDGRRSPERASPSAGGSLNSEIERQLEELDKLRLAQ